ncbi:RNA-binding protein Pasilla isoform X2 [Bacillus rossius redtenbacheri]|uniref:RNA-binding protein Pasilla isoform X2 n=1 Tax=Bacillus rossius redtenbacheri TaxID=93214 RepID=UPI002FDEB4A1
MADSGMETCISDPELSDSRKRPLDGDVENGSTKRSHFGGGGDGMYHLKILVPGTAAGAIIGKGGETIAHIQKDTGAKVKMSKANDFYPGTSERVCLITGSVEAIMSVMNFISEKIREKPEKEFETKPSDREKQVKILIPNTTAGMIIGKGGNYIKQIKEESGAYVQISQKARDQSLHERCITVIGDVESNRKALLMILEKIVEDPQSGSVLNVSYADISGPVANFNPTGSPYAHGGGAPASMHGFGGNSLNMGALLMGGGGGGGMGMGMGGGGGGASNSLNLSLNLSGPTGSSHSLTSQLLDHIKVTLRSSGYTDQATGEIIGAMTTLARYGILGMGLGLSGGGSSSQFLGFGGMDGGSQPLNGGAFGPIGTMASSSPRAGDRFGDGVNYDLFKRQGNPLSVNNNSFGLGTSQSALSPGGDGGEGADNPKKIEMEISENIVGAILGTGGRALVEIQHYSGAAIQISKKGVFAPGTRNRIVTISGPGHCISTAQYLIEQRVTEEEAKRSRGSKVTA